MAHSDSLGEYFKGFSKLNQAERMARLVEMGALTADDVKFLNTGGVNKTDLAENLIENVIGYFQLPLGVAANLRIDNKDVAVPMAVEETSIIAAVSKTAKWIRENGEITTSIEGDCIIGQIQIAHVSNFEKLAETIDRNKCFLIENVNQEVAHGLVRRGGGIKDITLRKVERGDGTAMAVIHLLADPCDAMGANIINQACEFLKEPVQNLTGETVTMCILSNLNDEKLTTATVTLRDIEPELGFALQEASIFAEQDPYRAATNNKGVLNGIDPILIATGNDWRAVEAGIHAYACRDGQYRSITSWRYDGKDLIGCIKAPIIVGTVGGVTKLHPTAQLCLKMLNVSHANELSRIIAAVGLVQNLGAIRALTTVGVVQGHMRLHIANLTLSVGANEQERPILQKHLEEILHLRKHITPSYALDALKQLRTQKPSEQTA